MTLENTREKLISKREKETGKEPANGSTDLITKDNGKTVLDMAKVLSHLENRLSTLVNGTMMSGTDLVKPHTNLETRSEEYGNMTDSMEKDRFKMQDNQLKM